MGTSYRWYRVLLIAVALYVLLLILALTRGVLSISWQDYHDAFVCYSSSNPAHFAIRELRIPRALLASLVGSSLAVSGALMQALTRNPLAGPSLMGLAPGASLCTLLALVWFDRVNSTSSIHWALMGAIGGYSIVCATAFATPGGFAPHKMALAGTVVSAVVMAVTQALTILFSLQDEMLFWTLGGLAHVSWRQLGQVFPYFLCGITLSLLFAKSVTILSVGQIVAVSIGQRVALTRFAVSAAVLLLTASTIAIAGPIGFVGLMVPHIARGLVGVHYSRVIPMCIVLGACLTLTADIAARSLSKGEEVPLGLLTALVGAPFLIYLVTSRPKAFEAS